MEAVFGVSGLFAPPFMDFVEQVKNQIDIVRVVGDYVRLKKQGSGERFVGLCPFHTEKTPSFSVHAGHGFYKCFGCGAGGDAIKFVMEMEGFTFMEAVKAIAERNGIAIPRSADFSDEDARKRTDLYRLHEAAQEVFARNLWAEQGEVARDYLARRNISEEQARDFGLGYANPGGQELVRLFEKQRVPYALLEQCGLVKPRQSGQGWYDTFRGRLTFPIHNESGKLVAFGARVLDPNDQPKYLNSSETDIYKKRSVLYRFHRAKESIRKQGRAVLVEGYMDVLGAWTAGVTEALATCGTALSPEQVRSLRRHADVVVVNFDPDRAGESATERSIQVLLEESVDVRVLQLPEGLDPDEYVASYGAEAYQQAVSTARGYFTWLAERAKQRFDLTSAAGRMQALEFLLPVVLKVNDKLRRSALADEVTASLGLERDLVLDRFRKAAVTRKQDDLRDEQTAAILPLERILISSLVNQPDLANELMPLLPQIDSWRKLPAASVLEAMIRVWQQNEPLNFHQIEPRLQEADKDLLRRILLDEEVYQASQTREQALACLQKLDLIQITDFRRDLKRRIREAELGGDFEEAILLAQQLNEIDSQRTQLTKSAEASATTEG
jgi:DNA primase